MAVIADLNVAKQFCPSPNDHVVANTRRAPPPTQVTQRDTMIERAIFANARFRMHNNATEVMNTQTLANPGLR
jgi:hypothetical protein